MKTIIIFLAVTISFNLSSCSQDFKKLSDTEVDKQKLQIAQDFAKGYLSKLREGSYYTFEDEAIDAIKNQLTEQNQKAVYRQLKEKFGDFQSLEYAETWAKGNGDPIRIFRFKSDFDNYNRKMEVRVVLNESDRIAGFWIKPWSDMLR